MRSRTRALLLFLCGLCVCASAVSAELVTEVGPDGSLTLEGGKRVVLAGVSLDSDGVSVLRVLVKKQDLKFQLLANSPPGALESAYAYLQAKYLKFPVKPDGIPDEQEILINEFLLKLGAAQVAESQDFSRKASFLKVQEEAKRKGEGIWSYEAS